MSKPDETVIDNDWPLADLEYLNACPYCGSSRRILAYRDVQDWTFRCAPGKWNYWGCQGCGTLYLDPRPTKESVGRAYATYYTHGASWLRKLSAAGKTPIRNLCYFAWHGIELHPRISLPKFMFPALAIFRQRIASPSFILQKLNQLPKGRLVDVGCGDGLFLEAGRQLGWDTLGIELDPEAVRVARKAGHEVVHGTHEALAAFENEVDCIICSHVIEHVHNPNFLLSAVSRALKMGGVALVSLPNAGSVVLQAVSENWRGLEAPRHLAIPRYESFREMTCQYGLSMEASFVSRHETLDASLAIARNRGVNMHELNDKVTLLQQGLVDLTESNSDFINLVLKKIAAPPAFSEDHIQLGQAGVENIANDG